MEALNSYRTVLYQEPIITGLYWAATDRAPLDMALLKDVCPKYLYTDRLTLELLSGTAEQYKCALDALNSNTAYERMGDFGVHTQDDFDAFGRTCRLQSSIFKNGMADADLYYLVRLGRKDRLGQLMGGVSLCQRTARSGLTRIILPPDIGWGLKEEFMGKGYATEAAAELLRFAREGLGWKDIVVFPNDKNIQSNRVAEKLGFVEGGHCPNLDNPETMLSIWILPGMPRIDQTVKCGLSFSTCKNE